MEGAAAKAMKFADQGTRTPCTHTPTPERLFTQLRIRRFPHTFCAPLWELHIPTPPRPKGRAPTTPASWLTAPLPPINPRLSGLKSLPSATSLALQFSRIPRGSASPWMGAQVTCAAGSQLPARHLSCGEGRSRRKKKYTKGEREGGTEEKSGNWK